MCNKTLSNNFYKSYLKWFVYLYKRNKRITFRRDKGMCDIWFIYSSSEFLNVYSNRRQLINTCSVNNYCCITLVYTVQYKFSH